MTLSRLLACGALGFFSCAPLLAQQVTIYGRLDMSLSYQSRIFVNNQVTDQSVRAIDSGGYAGSRVGFRGTEDLGGGLKSLFVLEQGVQEANHGQRPGAVKLLQVALHRRHDVNARAEFLKG